MKNAVIYVRVSSKEQLEGTSLEVQERICRDYAIREGFEVLKVFIEKGESAKTTDRTELKLLLNYVAKNHKNLYGIIVYKVDRLARVAFDYATLKIFFNKYGLRLLSASETLEETPVGRWVETMLAGTAQFDNEVRTERSVNGMTAAVKAGRYVWGAPLGYLNSGGRGTSNLIQDVPELVRLIRHCWVLVDTGCTVEMARKEVTKEGLKTKKAKPVSKSNFNRMFKNKVYMGLIEKFRLSIVGNFKPIVEPELFQRVYDKLYNTGKKIPIYRKDNEDFPVRGIILCSDCGNALTASWNRGNGGKYANYRCTHCPRKNYNRDDRNTKEGFKEGVETKFLKLLKNYSYKQELKDALLKAIEANLEHRNEANKKRVNELNKQIIQLKADERRIAEKNFKNVLSDSLAKEMLDENAQKVSELTLELHGYEDVKEDVMKVAKHSIGILEDISNVWLRVDLDVKKRFQKFLFPDGLPYDGIKFGTARLAYCIEPKWTSTPQVSRLVSDQGVEP